ncbi:MAG: hypothetical protein MJD61_16035 [Proteobacteria bacterium]|nr:hypothetical protein [Pseudomonadota bacterium]
MPASCKSIGGTGATVSRHGRGRPDPPWPWLAEVERQLAILDDKEDEARWVARMLADIDRVWDAMGTENQGKLLRALVDRVSLDERSGAVEIVLADLEVDFEKV